MDDLISRQAAIDAVTKYCINNDLRELLADIECLPTADLSDYCDKLWKTAYERGKAEAHSRTGKWLMVEDADEDGNARYECSLCHAGETHTPRVKVSYCWNCGARMTEESK